MNGVTDGVLVRMGVQFVKLVDASRTYVGPTLPLICRVKLPAAKDAGMSVIGGPPLALRTLNVNVVPE